ncbi:uncharacterized protein N7515_003373 [Penicillium bovifimosum]|uniref:Mtf2-like C-terminal domain-containing protein n=1 Tax=Penicillium bovifimosum TaxID=126998 RepID=A0A9W9L655_9EURO|nr:uncharacterized protein N7515_003373 [Penicillium bovifimosum]KAJ5138525.1 hypothetical protein N7515_003373 [Penicillium bovifimosum]
MATNITRLCFVSSTTSSSAPFLYHTRTLASLSPPFRQLDRRFSRSYSTQNSAVEINEAPETRTPEDKSSRDASEESIISSTPKQETRRPRRSFLHQRATHERPSYSRKPKVTTQEQQVFGSLLEKLGIKHDGESAEVDSTIQMSEDKKAEMAELKSLFDPLLKNPMQKRAALRAEARRKREQHETYRRQKQEEAEARELLREEDYGPKRIKLRDLGYSEPASNTGVEPTVTLREATNIVVRTEFEHIEFLLFQAVEDGTGDLGVWEVCKERIFSMLNHLDEKSLEKAIEKSLEVVDPDSVSPEDQDRPDTTISGSGPLRVPAVVPVGPVVVVLYPKSLLVAFRLLRTHFPNSPLIPEFRSTIKEYGRVSAFLGASSGLYDELIHYYWRVCKDLPAVVSILSDMNQLGINPAYKTRNLLIDLIIQQRQDVKDQQSVSFWDLPSTKDAYEQLTREGGWMDQIEARTFEDKERWSRAKWPQT